MQKNIRSFLRCLFVIAGFILALLCSFVFQLLGFSGEIPAALGRIAAGIVIALVFRGCFKSGRQFSGVVIALPALLFAGWNILDHFLTQGALSPLSSEILILGFAPAVFEEVIFRGVFVHNMKAAGKTDLSTLLVTALFFGVIHLTNAVGGNVLQTLVQTLYATVVGLVFGAVYLKSGDLVSVILVHAATDITSRVFTAGRISSTGEIILFAALLAAEAAYALWLILGRKK